MRARRRALATAGVACLAGFAIAGCSPAGSSSTSAVTITGDTLRIYLSEPPDLATNSVAQDVVDAEQLAYDQQRSEVTDYKLELVTRKGTTLSQNARAAIIDKTAIAYLGEVEPGTSDQTVGITNALDLLQISPTDTALELSQSTPAVSGAPKTYFESWGTYGRTFARVVPSAADEAKAQIAEMKSDGVTSLYVTSDGSDYGDAIADAVSADARAAGLTLTTKLDGAGAAFDGAMDPHPAAQFYGHAASVSPTTKLFGPSALNTPAFTSALPSSVRKLLVSIPGFLPGDLPAAGKKFVTDFKARYHHTPNVEAIFGYAAMSAVLRTIELEGKQADDRTAIVKRFLSLRKVPSVVGTYSIDSAGNTTLDAFVFARLSGGALVPFAAAPTAAPTA